MTSSVRSGRDAQLLEELHQIVLDNLSNEQFGVEELAKSYGISRSQLHRKLKKLTKKSISRYIREIRLDEAHKMLQEDVGTVSEIAYKVGFSSPTYFNTCFRDYFGYPPGEAKFHNEAEPSTIVRTPDGHKRKSFLLGLSAVLLLALAWLAFINYQNGTEIALIDEKPVEKTIAVLPFKNWSGDPDLEYVSDGMTDAVITRLSKIGDIQRVTPFSSVLRYKNTDMRIPEIAEELDVQYVLEGNFKLSGEDVQSSLNLIEVKTNQHLWSLEYNGFWETDQIFEMQAEIAENVAEYMEADIMETERIALRRKPTISEEAYRLYLQAEYQFTKLRISGFENSIQLFNESIKHDSTYIDPILGLANVYYVSGLVWGILPEQQAWARTREYLNLALQKDKYDEYTPVIDMMFRHGTFYYELDIPAVEKGYLESDYKETSFSRNYSEFDYTRKTGRFDSSMRIIESALEQDPTFGQGYMQKAIIFYLQGKEEQAIEVFSNHDVLLNDNYFYLQESSKYYYYMGKFEKSKRHLELMLSQFPDRPPIAFWLSAIHAHIDSDSELLTSSLEKLQDMYLQGGSGSPAWFLALYYIHANDLDSAFEWLQKSYDRREVELTWLKEEPMLKSVKTNSRYIELYNLLGFNVIEELSEPKMPKN